MSPPDNLKNLIFQCEFTSLSMAIRAGSDNSADVLISFNASLNNDRFLLESSIYNCKPEISVKLCQAGAFDFLHSEIKNKLLAIACKQSRIAMDLILMMLSKGADPAEAKDPETGVCVLSLSGATKCSPAVLKVLFEHLMKNSEPLTPEQLKGLSQVQIRYLRRRS